MQEIEKFQQIMPLFVSLGNQDLRDRHWAKILKELKIIQPLKITSFQDMLDAKAEEKKDFIEEISSRASGEALV